MAEVRRNGEVTASVDEVWKLISDFGGFIEAMGMPVELDGEGIGQTRTIRMGPEPTVERLEECDGDTRRLVYSIVSGPVPVSNYRSTMQLSPTSDGRTTLEWSSTFDPAPGATEEKAVTTVERIYEGGIAAIKARFSS